MRSIYYLAVIFLLFISNPLQAGPKQEETKEQVQIFINLLAYVGKDYHNAVANGTIKNESEYKEMASFSRRINTIFNKLSPVLKLDDFTSLKPQVEHLASLIEKKAPVSTVSQTAVTIREKVLALRIIKVTPPYWPDLAKGKQMFTSHCSSCHGVNGAGNGPLARQLDPAPTNFQDSLVAATLSPLQAYNTIRLGVDGTAMRAFHELSDQQAWNIAFYINGLSFDDSVSTEQRKAIDRVLTDTLSLEALATIPNKKWEHFFSRNNIDPGGGMKVLRSKEQGNSNEERDLALALSLLNQTSQRYKSGDKAGAGILALKAYLQGIEPKEAQIKATAPHLVTTIEEHMFAIRSTIKKGASASVLDQHIQQAKTSIEKAQDLLNNQDYSFWFTFIVSASILLREGMEAFLIIMVILSVLKSVGAKHSLKFVHGGWLLALALGIISWFFTDQLIQMSPFQREFMEGLGSIIAMAMLLYIGYWLHNKTYASQWTKFVKEKIHRLIDNNNNWGLGILAFIVVFREAFESVIFLSSIGIETSPAGELGIIVGSISAIIVVLLLGVLMMKFSRNVPIQSLFKYSSLVMAILAVILVGKGIHAFQEAGYLSVLSVPMHFNLPLFGIYPTLQTIMAQVIIIGSIIVLWYYSKRMALKSA